MAVNPHKLNSFMGKAVGDMGPPRSTNIVLLGDKLGSTMPWRRKVPSRRRNSQRQQRQPNGTSVGSWANKSQVDT
jgi:hypothetical protein